MPALTEKDKVLLLRAEEASVELNKALDKAKISYQACPIYHTKVDKRKGEELNRN